MSHVFDSEMMRVRAAVTFIPECDNQLGACRVSATTACDTLACHAERNQCIVDNSATPENCEDTIAITNQGCSALNQECSGSTSPQCLAGASCGDSTPPPTPPAPTPSPPPTPTTPPPTPTTPPPTPPTPTPPPTPPAPPAEPMECNVDRVGPATVGIGSWEVTGLEYGGLALFLNFIPSGVVFRSEVTITLSFAADIQCSDACPVSGIVPQFRRSAFRPLKFYLLVTLDVITGCKAVSALAGAIAPPLGGVGATLCTIKEITSKVSEVLATLHGLDLIATLGSQATEQVDYFSEVQALDACITSKDQKREPNAAARNHEDDEPIQLNLEVGSDVEQQIQGQLDCIGEDGTTRGGFRLCPLSVMNDYTSTFSADSEYHCCALAVPPGGVGDLPESPQVVVFFSRPITDIDFESDLALVARVAAISEVRLLVLTWNTVDHLQQGMAPPDAATYVQLALREPDESTPDEPSATRALENLQNAGVLAKHARSLLYPRATDIVGSARTPAHEDVYQGSVCGNNVVEPLEECDVRSSACVDCRIVGERVRCATDDTVGCVQESCVQQQDGLINCENQRFEATGTTSTTTTGSPSSDAGVRLNAVLVMLLCVLIVQLGI